MKLQEASYFVLNKMRSIYDEGEASQIADWVMEAITGSAKAERMLYKNHDLTAIEEDQLNNFTNRLLKNEPIQYVLNEAWFYGLRLYVNKQVLIPRPETEELVEWILKNISNRKAELSILDVGTGSGCIAIALKSKLPNATVYAFDISEEALSVARKNATKLGTTVNFITVDILDKTTWPTLNAFDIIVSNPPYIPEFDKPTMHANVLANEPHLALFVPNNDVLKFYKAVTAYGKKCLKKTGNLYFEIHEEYGQAIVALLASEGFSAMLKKDMQQKDRMVKSGLA